MKNLLLISASFLIAVAACGQMKKLSPHETVTGKGIKVTYGRPYKKDRVIFGGLLKYGEVWRCGADESTEITFDKDVLFAGKPVKAGTYTLFVIPNEKEWSIILNSDTKFWGTEHEAHKAKDILTVKVPVKMLDKVVEQLTIRFDSPGMIIEWDKTQVAIPVS